MALKVTVEEQEDRHLLMTIEPDQETVDRELRKAARRVAQQVRIPGFRRGKIPYQVLVQYVGMEALVDEFAGDLGNALYPQALEEAGIKPFAMGVMQDMQVDPLRYTVLVPLPPEVKLGDYRQFLRVEEPEVVISDEQVQAAIDDMLDKFAEYRDIDQPSEYGDLITLDVRAVVLDEEGNETDVVVLDEKDWDVTPDTAYPMEPAGLDEAIVGMSAGEEKQFDIHWAEDSDSMYAGKDVRFSVTVHAIQRYMRPELTDEFVVELGEYESVADLYENMRTALASEAEETRESENLDKILDALIELSEIRYPPEAVEMEIDFLLHRNERQFIQMGLKGLDQFLELTKQDLESYRENLRPIAEKQLRQQLALEELIKAESITATDEEVREQISAIVRANHLANAYDDYDDEDDDDIFEDDELEEEFFGEDDFEDDDEDESDEDESDDDESDEDESDEDESDDDESDEDESDEDESDEDESEDDDFEDDDFEDDDDDEIDEEEIEKTVDFLLNSPNSDVIKEQIERRKALDFLKALARGEELPLPAAPEAESVPAQEGAAEEGDTEEDAADERSE